MKTINSIVQSILTHLNSGNKQTTKVNVYKLFHFFARMQYSSTMNQVSFSMFYISMTGLIFLLKQTRYQFNHSY